MAFGHYTRPPRGLGRSFDFRLTPSTFRLYFALRARSGVALPRHDLAPSGVSRIQSALPMRERFAGRSPKKRTATKSVRVNARAAQRVAAPKQKQSGAEDWWVHRLCRCTQASSGAAAKGEVRQRQRGRLLRSRRGRAPELLKRISFFRIKPFAVGPDKLF